MAAEVWPFCVEAPRDHDLRAALPFLHQLRRHLGRMLEIAVHRDHGAAARVAQARTQRRLMPEIAGEGDVADRRIAGRERTDGGERAIGRAVVDENDLVLAKRPRDLGKARRHAGDIAHLIVRRQDERQRGSTHGPGHIAKRCPGDGRAAFWRKGPLNSTRARFIATAEWSRS